MVTVTNLEILQGLLSLIFCIISIMVGIKMILKYVEHKNRTLLWAGISWILIISPYFPDAINLILILTMGIQLNLYIYFLIGAGGLLPFATICWIYTMVELLWEKEKRLIMSLCIIGELIFFGCFLTFLFIDLSLIGTQITPFYAEWSIIIAIYLIITIILFDISGFFFIKKSLKAESKEVTLKARFLAFGLVIFTIGVMMDTIGGLTEVTLVIARIFVIIGCFSFYIGFILPQFIKNIFLE